MKKQKSKEISILDIYWLTIVISGSKFVKNI